MKSLMDDEPIIEINIEPRKDVLRNLGIPFDEFDTSLEAAIDLNDSKTENDVLPVYELPITLGGRTFSLNEVADIQVTGDPDLMREINDEDEHA